MKKYLATTAVAALALALAACDSRMVYDRYAHTPTSGWEKNDTLSFGVPPVDAAAYAATLGLRTTGDYPFTALTLVVEQRVYPGGEVYTDTLHCQLTDRRGNAATRGVSYHQYEFRVRTVALQQGDSIHVRIRHDMKREILPGVSDVGFSLRRE